jgi:hypothetical protein
MRQTNSGDLFTGLAVLMWQRTRPGLLLRFDILVNHLLQKSRFFNAIECCLNFNQTSQMPSQTVIRVCSPQVFNRVIHRFRGYPE